MTGFQGYDQWKTATPYDDCDDEHCAYCGADLPDDVTGFSDEDDTAVHDGFCNTKCGALGADGSVSPRWGLPHFTFEQIERRDALQDRMRAFKRDNVPQLAKLKDILEFLPKEGDFKWDGADCPDTDVYCCGEKDCEQQWHESWSYTEFSRENGALEILVLDGEDKDCTSSWREGDDWIGSGVAYDLGPEPMNDHFYGWAGYYLDAAETGKDPCSQFMFRNKPGNWIDDCLNAAENNINYLSLPPTQWQLIWRAIRRLYYRLRRFNLGK